MAEQGIALVPLNARTFCQNLMRDEGTLAVFLLRKTLLTIKVNTFTNR